MDKLDWAVQAFRKANRNAFNLPFTWIMRKRAGVDPLEAVPRLRNQRQKSKHQT